MYLTLNSHHENKGNVIIITLCNIITHPIPDCHTLQSPQMMEQIIVKAEDASLFKVLLWLKEMSQNRTQK